MNDSTKSPETPSPWTRPVRGRAVSGVCRFWAERLGLPVLPLRLAFVAAALAGAGLFVAFGVFDAALLGESAHDALRVAMMVVGGVLVLAYPIQALIIPDGRRPWKWDFGSAFMLVVLLTVTGHVIGDFLLARYVEFAKRLSHEIGNVAFLTWPVHYLSREGLALRDVVVVLFVVSTAAFVYLQRKAVRRFFRAVHTGVTLVVLSTTAVAVGVLVPQIDGFEDPEQRVDLDREYEDYTLFQRFGYQKLPAQFQDRHQQYQAFRWAEGYFLYHLLHLYGFGMPEVAISPSMEESLERFGDKYGIEERDNRRKQMTAALSGQEKVSEIGDFIHRNEPAFWRAFELCTVLELNRTYKSSWFAALLWLLGTSILFNTLNGGPRQWFSIQKLGFFTVHVGMLTLLMGGCTSKLMTERGLMQLDLREPPEDSFSRFYDPTNKGYLPFTLRLDHFARKEWMALRVHFPQEEFKSRPPAYTLWRDKIIDLDYVPDEARSGMRPRIRLRVVDLFDRVEVGQPIVNDVTGQPPSGDPRFPVAELVVQEPTDHAHAPDDGHDHSQLQYLIPLPGILSSSEYTYRDPRNAFRLAPTVDPDPAKVFPLGGDQPLGIMEVLVSGTDEVRPRPYRVRLGERIEVAGGYTIQVVDATSDHDDKRDNKARSIHSRPLAEQPLTAPAIWVDVTSPDGKVVERRIVEHGIDAAQHEMQGSFANRDVLVNFYWDVWTSPGPPRYVLAWGAGRAQPVLVAEDGTRTSVELGRPLPLPGNSPVIVRSAYEQAEFEKNVRFVPPVDRADEWDQDFYARSPRGLRLEVTYEPGTPDEHSEVVEMATTEHFQSNLWFSADERFVLEFFENSEMLPFEWRSVLSVLEEDAAGNLVEVDLGSERDREIRVNDYLYHEGYRFFQTDANARFPTYSGIGVVYDPGIPIVLAGMYTIIAGTLIAFIVRPIVLGLRERKGATP